MTKQEEVKRLTEEEVNESRKEVDRVYKAIARIPMNKANKWEQMR